MGIIREVGAYYTLIYIYIYDILYITYYIYILYIHITYIYIYIYISTNITDVSEYTSCTSFPEEMSQSESLEDWGRACGGGSGKPCACGPGGATPPGPLGSDTDQQVLVVV